MVTRVGGLASGMDIDSIVEKLMSAEKAPLNKLQQQKQKYEWQRDAYRSVNTKLKAFDTYVSDNFTLKILNSKTASSSNSSLVSAVATSSASGSLSIEGVSQLASSARAVGQQINATSTTKVSTLTGGASSFSFKAIQSNGEMAASATTIEIDENMTVSQLVSKINASNAGITAVFENGRFSFTATNSGNNAAGDEIQIESGQGVLSSLGFYKDDNGQATSNFQTTDGKNAIFKINGIATERSTNTFSLNGYNVTLNSTFNELATYSANGTAIQTTLTNATTNMNNLLGSLSGTNGFTFNAANSISDNVTAAKAALTQKVTDKQAAVTAATNSLNALKDAYYADANVNALSQPSKDLLNGLTKEQRDELAEKLATTDFADANWKDRFTKGWSTQQLTDLETNQTELKTLNMASINQTVGNKYTALSTEAKEYLKANPSLADIDSSSLSQEEKDLLVANAAAFSGIAAQQDIVKAANAELTAVQNEANNLVNTTNAYNAAMNASNDYAANAPSSNSTVSAVNVTSTNNVDDTISKIKEFINTYNGLIKDLSGLTKESQYRDYAPLTDDQRKEMEEDEIKLWEEKAKSGLLRSDSIISSGLSSMRSLVYESYPGVIDTKYNSLFSIGITTSSSYTDGGTLEINEDKLRKALEDNPDAVEQLLKNSSGKKNDTVDGKTVDTRGYFAKLRESIDGFEKKIETKAGRTSMTDNQYSLGKTLIDTDKRISTWKTKLENIEERYWKQFTAMETAISKANSQSSLFTS